MQNVDGEKGLRVISTSTCEAGSLSVSSHCMAFFLWKEKKKGVCWSLLEEINVCIAGDRFYSPQVKPEIRSGTPSAGKFVGAEAGPVLPRWCLCFTSTSRTTILLQVWIFQTFKMYLRTCSDPSPIPVVGKKLCREDRIVKPECSWAAGAQLRILSVLRKYHQAWGCVGFPGRAE